MYKLSFGSLVLFCALALSSCQQQDAQQKITAAGQSPDNKPTFDVAPRYDESQFQKGQWIEWQRTSSGGLTECLRWIITDFVSSGIALEGRISRACQTPDNFRVEHILFNPTSGEVVEDVIVTPNSTTAGSLKSIFAFIYGAPEKVTFKVGELILPGKKFPAFRVLNQTQVYLNSPKSPFHAFAIKWLENRDGIKWSYELKQSNPIIESLPTHPSNP